MQKSDWKKCKLGDVCYPVSETYDFSNREKVVFINTGDISFGKFLKKEYEPVVSLPGQAKKSIQKNDILFSEIRPANGRFALVDFDAQDFVVSTKLMVLRAQPIIDLKFLYLLLTNKYTLAEFQHIAESRSGTFPQITFDAISYFPIDLPPLEEQKRIAQILGALDDKMELLQKQNKTLEDMAKALFKSWFVDFDVVHAKQQGLPKSDIMREYHLTDELYDLFPSGFESSALGPIPLGWQVKTLESLCNIFTGRKDVKQTVENGKYIFFSCSPKTFRSNEYLYDGQAVIVAGNGSFTGRVSFYEGKFDLYQRTYAITSNENKKMLYLYHVMKYFFEPNYMGGTRGSSIPYIVKGDLANFKFVFAQQLIDNYEEKITSLFSKIQNNNKQIQTLTELRDTLLPPLISGKIRV